MKVSDLIKKEAIIVSSVVVGILFFFGLSLFSLLSASSPIYFTDNVEGPLLSSQQVDTVIVTIDPLQAETTGKYLYVDASPGFEGCAPISLGLYEQNGIPFESDEVMTFTSEEYNGYVMCFLTYDLAGAPLFLKSKVFNIEDGLSVGPVIILAGDVIIKVNQGTEYVDQGARYEDNFDGTGIFEGVSNVNTAVPGHYTVTFDYTDSDGNTATTKYRHVEVLEVPGWSVPTISLNGDEHIRLEVFSSDYEDAGAVYNDNQDGTGPITGVGEANLDVVGEYIITYNYTDNDGNQALEVTRRVTVRDTITPIITLLGDNPIFVEKGANYVDAGATCVDNYDGTLEVEEDAHPVDTNIIGEWELFYDCTDSNGNSSSNSDFEYYRIIYVVDSSIDEDGDNLADWVEDFGPNDGDVNGDGILDSTQADVTSLENEVTGEYISLDATSGETTCSVVGFNVVSEASLDIQDPANDYPVGLNDFSLDCEIEGATMEVKIYYDQAYDTSNWIFKKYNEDDNTYIDMSSIVTYTTESIGVLDVTVASYSITDGGIYDGDGLTNGVIIDPSGPSVGAQGPGLGECGEGAGIMEGKGNKLKIYGEETQHAIKFSELNKWYKQSEKEKKDKKYYLSTDEFETLISSKYSACKNSDGNENFIPLEYKIKIENLTAKLSKFDAEKKESLILISYSKLAELQDKKSKPEKQNLINYLQMKLSIEYFR